MGEGHPRPPNVSMDSSQIGPHGVAHKNWEFNQMLIQAVRRGDLVTVQWILAHFTGCTVTKDVVKEAAQGGHLWILQLLESAESVGEIHWGHSCVSEAAGAGHWGIVHWLDKKINTPESRRKDESTLGYAYEQGNFDQFKWATAMGFSRDAFYFHGNDSEKGPQRKRVVRYLIENENEECVRGPLEEAINVGDFEFVKWVASDFWSVFDEEEPDYEDPHPFFTRCLQSACRCGHMEIVEWMLSNSSNMANRDPSDAILAAIECGQRDLVQWLYEQYGNQSRKDYDPDRDVSTYFTGEHSMMDVAASCGYLEVLQFLNNVDQSLRSSRTGVDLETNSERRQSLSCTPKAMDGAAAGGHYEVVKWLHINRSEGCTMHAMDSVAAGCDLSPERRLSFLQWLHFNRREGCSFAAMDGAAANGDLKILQWLHDNTRGGCSRNAMEAAARGGHLDIVQWLHYHYYHSYYVSPAIACAASRGHLNVIKWLYANHRKVSLAEAVVAAASQKKRAEVEDPLFVVFFCHVGFHESRHHLHVIKWLLAHSSPPKIKTCIMPAMRKAIKSGLFEVALFLHAQPHDFSIQDVKIFYLISIERTKPKTFVLG